MLEKELLKKLSQLKKIKADLAWKTKGREILASQISAQTASYQIATKFNLATFFGDLIPQISFELPRAVWLVVLILAIFTSGSAISVYASRDSKPGDSLYIAKIISEKAQSAITFGDRGKTKLNLEFASNRAKEITQVLDEAAKNMEEKSQKVDQLAKSFKQEINLAKNNLEKIKVNKLVSSQVKPEEAKINLPENQPGEVFGANLDKNNQRLEITEPQANQPASPPSQPSASQSQEQATSSPENLSQNKTEVSAQEILAQAEKLFADEDYQGTIDKLQQVNNLIDESSDSGQVQGVMEDLATTTDD